MENVHSGTTLEGHASAIEETLSRTLEPDGLYVAKYSHARRIACVGRMQDDGLGS